MSIPKIIDNNSTVSKIIVILIAALSIGVAINTSNSFANTTIKDLDIP
ncbi:MAG: hypothetical protein HQK69_11080, partial [Desulfamplus sp.]|nr:hypothetical protein [Desulfamplus sp.]